MIQFFEDNFIKNYEPKLRESDRYWIKDNWIYDTEENINHLENDKS